MGRLAELRGPTPCIEAAIDTFVRAYGVDLSEAITPDEGYRSFDEFFTRRLKPGARPLAQDVRAVLCPADGRVEDFGRITADGSLEVKGKPYTVKELLGDSLEAERYEGGQYAIVYLSPRDYHRVHAPVSGAVDRVRYIPGTLFPVNQIGLDHVPQLFARNERVAIVQETATHGEVTTLMVGAIGVGRIGLAFDDLLTNVGQAPGIRHYDGAGAMLERGQELGVFHLGSTAIVFLTRQCEIRFGVTMGEQVRMGQALGVGGHDEQQ